jgi:hypothetical protein
VYELAEVRGRLAQRLYELGDGLYELPEALRDVARVLSFNVGRSSFGSTPLVFRSATRKGRPLAQPLFAGCGSHPVSTVAVRVALDESAVAVVEKWGRRLFWRHERGRFDRFRVVALRGIRRRACSGENTDGNRGVHRRPAQLHPETMRRRASEAKA